MLLQKDYARAMGDFFLLESAGANPTDSPQNPWIVLEGKNITFAWTYTLDSAIALARFINVTGGGSGVTIAQHIGGSTTVVGNFPTRFSANISATRAEITLHGVQLSDQGDYVFDLSTSDGGGFRSETVELIVNCKYLRITSCL